MVRQLLVIWAAIALVWFALNVPARQVLVQRKMSGGRISTTESPRGHKTGGFPWVYCQFTESPSGRAKEPRHYRIWKKDILVWNVISGLGVAFALTGYVVFANRRKDAAKEETKKQFSLAGLLVTMAFLGICLGIYRQGKSGALFGLQRFNHPGGSALAKAELPEWLVSHVDVGFLLRPQTGRVNCSECDDNDLQRITRMRSLDRLSLSAPTSDTICDALKLPQLRSLSISNFELDEAVCDAVRESSSVTFVSFQFPQTPPTEMLHRLCTKSSENSARISITLTMPDELLQLEDLETLHTLELVGLTAGGRVVLRGLPSLSALRLGPFLLKSLEAQNLPKLQEIQWPGGGELSLINLAQLSSLSIGDEFPSRLTLQDLPMLKYRDDWKYNHGIGLNSAITAELVESLGEFAGAVRVKNWGGSSKMTFAALVSVLQHRNPKVLDFGSAGYFGFEIAKDINSMHVLDSVREFRSPRFDDQSVYALLAKTPNLTHLVAGDGFEDSHIPLLKGLTKLEELDLSDSGISLQGWKQLPEFTKAKHVVPPSWIKATAGFANQQR